jgi:hypothetical protein
VGNANDWRTALGKTIEAVFDGLVLRPAQPLELEPNTRVWLVVETMPPLVDKQGVLVVRTKPDGDLNVIQQQRNQRVSDLMH